MTGCMLIRGVASLVACAALAAPFLAAAPTGGDSQPLTPVARSIFDGRTLGGWEGGGDRWRVDDGTITVEMPAAADAGRTACLRLSGEQGDFELELEYRISDPAAAAGILYRSRHEADGRAVGYRVALDHGAEGAGRIIGEAGRGVLVERGRRAAIAPDARKWSDPLDTPPPAGKEAGVDGWTRLRIRAVGPHVTVFIDDGLVAVLDDRDAKAARAAGGIGLELSSGTVAAKAQFRNIRLTDLAGEWRLEPVAVAAAAGQAKPPRDLSSPVLWHLVPNVPADASGRQAAGAAKALQSLAGMKVTPGFRCDLVAAEPDIHQPIAFAIDPRGRLWVVEAHCYPTRRKDGAGIDRVVILADEDGNGSFETRKVFVEGLNLVSGIEVGFGGVWIGAAPHLLFIPDRDGNDIPDGPGEVVLDGWGFGDTHETLNSFSWGPDGWLYGNHGVFTSSNVGRPGAPDDQRKPIKAGVWRYHPVREVFEIFAHGGSNQWGIDFTSVGDAFMTHCRSFHGGGGTSHVIRNGHYWNQVNGGYAPFISPEGAAFAPGLKNYLPAASRYDSGAGGAGKPGTDAVYGGHSHVGTMIYLGDNWPAAYRDRLFTLNLHGAQINHQEIVRQRSGYEVFPAGHDLAYNPDPQYLAVDLQYGPDGSVYVIDWCDKQHCHNTNAQIWDRSTGRVYRLAWAESFKPVKVDLTRLDDAALVAVHSHRNEWHVRTARRLLQERAAAGRLDRTAVAPLARVVGDTDPVVALRAIWTLHVVGALDDGLLGRAIAHPSDHMRGWAVTLATEEPGRPRIGIDVLAGMAEKDPSALVRRSIASALPAISGPDRWRVARLLAAHAEDAGDRFLPKLIWSGIGPDVDKDPAAALDLAAATPLEPLADSIRLALSRSDAGRELLVAEIAAAPEAVAGRTLRILEYAMSKSRAVTPPRNWQAAMGRFRRSKDLSAAVSQLAVLFGDETERGRLRSTLADRAAAPAARLAAIKILDRVGDAEAVSTCAGLLDDKAVFGRILPLVSRSNDPAVPGKLAAALPGVTGPERTQLIAVLASKPAFARSLLAEIAAKRLAKDEINAVVIRQLRSLKDAELAVIVDATFGKVKESSAAARETMARLKKTWNEVPKFAIDGKHGQAVFVRSCAACHVHGGAGGRLGPNLTGSAVNGADYFIDNLVDPNLVVGPDYQLTTVSLDDGRVINGIIAEEAGGTVVLRTPEGNVTIRADEIEDRKTAPVSMMPAGILEALPEGDMLALIKFLTTP